MCAKWAFAEFERYESKEGIIVENIITYHCSNEDCEFTWLPSDQEKIINKKCYDEIK